MRKRKSLTSKGKEVELKQKNKQANKQQNK